MNIAFINLYYIYLVNARAEHVGDKVTKRVKQHERVSAHFGSHVEGEREGGEPFSVKYEKSDHVSRYAHNA